VTRPYGPDDFGAHQDAMARWMGYDTAAELNREHDPLHADLCAWLGIESRALRHAAGESLSREDQALAGMEEDAVLYLQRFRQMTRKLTNG
jgi:hypothetical protein